jgi:predicted MPP superfamily phosphohydrolase
MQRWLPRLAIAATVGALIYYRLRHVNPYRPRLERIEFPLPPGAERLDGLRIGFVTDTHVGPFTTVADIQRGLALFDAEPLDLLLLGGDYVSESNLYAPGMANTIGALAARTKLGAIAVMGNHDLPLGANRVRSELERVGVCVLRNEHITVEWHSASLAIVGIDDTIVGHADPVRAFSGVPAGVPSLALWHEADFAEEAASHGAFAQLSGHTHGGQVRLPLIGAIWLPPDGKRRDLGFFEVEGMTVYISRGLGIYRPPVRFCCPPEVTLVTLRATSAHPAMR